MYASQDATAASNVYRSPAPPTPATVNPSCFGTLEDASHNVSGLAERVERIVNRLAGAYPEPGCATDKNVGSNGLFDEATTRALNIKANVGAMHAALDRLEKSLP